jgi:hypothetical protein
MQSLSGTPLPLSTILCIYIHIIYNHVSVSILAQVQLNSPTPVLFTFSSRSCARSANLSAMFRTIVALMVITLCAAVATCSDETCDGVPQESAHGSAMLQKSTSPHKQGEQPRKEDSGACAFTAAKDMSLKKASVCLPNGLQEKHLELLRINAASLAAGSATGTEKSSKRSSGGADAPLDAAGFKEVTSGCCPMETELFFNRLLESMDMKVCNKDHVQGLMHWFSCVPDMDYQYMVDTINNGNPCKYWAPSSSTCPVLSPECDVKQCR